MNTSDKFIVLTPSHLNDQGKNTPYWKVDYSCIKFHMGLPEMFRKADLVIFKDGYNINVLRNRFGHQGTIDGVSSIDRYNELRYQDSDSVDMICNKQQKFLSDVVDRYDRYDDDSYFLNSEEWWCVVHTLQRRWYETDQRGILNLIKSSQKVIKKILL